LKKKEPKVVRKLAVVSRFSFMDQENGLGEEDGENLSSQRGETLKSLYNRDTETPTSEEEWSLLSRRRRK